MVSLVVSQNHYLSATNIYNKYIYTINIFPLMSYICGVKCSGCFVTNSLVEATVGCVAECTVAAAGETAVRSSVKRVRK